MDEMKKHDCCNHGHACHCGGDKPQGFEMHSCCSTSQTHSCCSAGAHGFAVPVWLKLGVSAAALALGFFLSKTNPHFNALADPSWVAVVLCGLPIFLSARSLLEDGKIGAPTLVSLAMLAMVLLQFAIHFGADNPAGHAHGFIFAAGEVAFLMACGEALEERTVRRATDGVKRLAQLAPKTVFVRRGGGEPSEIPAAELKVGDVVVLKPHSLAPCDGVIISGESAFDQSNFTGESMPVEKSLGDTVLAATTNLSGAVEIRATKVGGDSAAGRLAKLVEEAAGTRAPISRIANIWAGRLVVAALAISVGVFFAVKFAFGADTMTALIRSATALVVFCPCAFVLATPAAIAAAIGNMSKSGIVVKSGAVVEELSKVDTVLFDKTGTLTRGEIAIAGCAAFGMDERELLRLAATAERMSEHPIAKAVLSRAEELGIEAEESLSTQSSVGVGVRCKSASGEIEVAKISVFEKPIAENAQAEKFVRRNADKTLAAVALNGKLAGLLAFSDKPRENAAQVVSDLKALGCAVEMLTGDNRTAALAAAEKIGIEHTTYEASPETKLEKIGELKNAHRTVCMCGDGVNDAPALAAANVSVALGKVGNDIAVENADITLLANDISAVPAIVEFSRSVMATIKTNMAISLVVSISAITAAAFGLLGPVAGALLHNLSSITVVANSARLLQKKIGK